ncbi:unnamed protein product [Gongylonema pulchrum]|uniref:GLTP domain-containing protein n=1 Tax=Gongylonema pulchrum TaxID=637853 RepID=A0A183EXQ2_9BILA|nr:unnamed protein product [Gongylonema pulchrum]
MCQTSYERTLSKHHSWIVRKCVGVAIQLFVTRDYLLNAIRNEKEAVNEDKIREAIARLVAVMENVYTRVQRIYESRNILDLP